jgi:hypothetical protein
MARFKELTAEQRRIAINAIQLYEHSEELRAQSRDFKGGLHWKKVSEREYLVRTVDRFGHERSLGPRTPATEKQYREFVAAKAAYRSTVKGLQAELGSRAKFCVAAGVNRVPRIAADIVRSLDNGGLLGEHLVILGSHALYAYEMKAGVQLKAGLLQTEDLDTLLNTKSEIELAGPIRSIGLIGILQRVDRTFKPQRQRSFRAVNDRGFMVDLIRAPLDPSSARLTSIGRHDLVAEELRGLEWLDFAPKLSQIVIADNGYPVRFVVPDPRLFALHKLWVSIQPTRDRIKQRRDLRQGEAAAELAHDYLDLKFDRAFLKTVPRELRDMERGLIKRLHQRRSKSKEADSGLPPGFEDFDSTLDD